MKTDRVRLPELVLPDSSLSATVVGLESRWQREFGGHRIPWEEAWLWAPEDGYALFARQWRLPLPGTLTWGLERVWLRKELRRHGLLSAAWALWRDRYGHFEVVAPNPEMKAFLRAFDEGG
jgi:hypothetical protein